MSPTINRLCHPHCLQSVAFPIPIFLLYYIYKITTKVSNFLAMEVCTWVVQVSLLCLLGAWSTGGCKSVPGNWSSCCISDTVLCQYETERFVLLQFSVVCCHCHSSCSTRQSFVIFLYLVLVLCVFQLFVFVCCIEIT